jgi:hypothetical protein
MGVGLVLVLSEKHWLLMLELSNEVMGKEQEWSTHANTFKNEK